MGNEIEFGIIKRKTEFPVRKLLMVPHKGDKLFVAYPAFGSDSFKNNIEKMQKFYFHPETGEKISFKEPITSKSISASAYGFGSWEEVDAKRDIFNPRWLQMGSIVRTSKGVFANPPKDKQGNPIIDEKILRSYLNKSTKVNGVYLGEDYFGFAPYGTFATGEQNSDTFARGGLARILEHTEKEVAENLKMISSPKNYSRGVDVGGFDDVKKPLLRIVGLHSVNFINGDKLEVGGYYGLDRSNGYAFGVLK